MPRALVYAVIACVLPGCSNALTRRAPAPSAQQIADSVLVARVNHALHTAGVDGYATLRITAATGSVILEGALASPRLVERALQTAGEVEGVASVTSRLVVHEGTK